ncbi:MAG: rhomboid family intramembrane serine protease [Desulfurococcales archaeon]|nr:rhomboid family intramembrane serine protease [Desulfurococcales archaeon]
MGIPVSDENVPASEPPIINMTLIILNVLIFFMGILFPGLLVPGAVSYVDVVNELGMKPAMIMAGEKLHTLLTSMFLHGGLAHLLGNMLYLYIFGDNIEAILGRWRYLLFYLISGLGASIFHIASIAFMPANALVNSVLAGGVNPWLIPAIGASGAISGVLGAYLLLFPGSRVRVVTFWAWIPLFLEFPAYAYIAFWFIYQLIMGLATSLSGVQAGVAFWAHIGGFLTGMALLPLLAGRDARVKMLMYYRARLLRYGY